MKYDITIHKGRLDSPAVIFIHGLGMDKRIWVKPDEARMLAGRFPIRYLLAKRPNTIDFGKKKEIPEIHKRFSIGDTKGELKTSFSDLQSLGHTVIAWSQKRPAGPIDIAVSELREVIELSKEYSRRGIILIGHSRGGLIARKYLQIKDRAVKGFITLATPHLGSSMAKWVKFISPLTSIIGTLMHEEDKKKFSYTIKRILDFIGTMAIKELLPDSEFFRSLDDSISKKIYCLSIGGTSPTLFSIYRWRLRARAKGGTFTWILEPVELFSIPDILGKIIPKKFYPEELKKKCGDGLVSAKSSVLPYCKEHYNFNVNHAAILFDEEVRRKIIEAVGRM